MEKLLPHFQIVVTSVYTSAALEAYSVGIPVITILDDNDINASPLRGVKGISFVRTPVELRSAFMRYSTKSFNKNMEKLFWLDTKLPKWRMLLDLK